MAAAEETLIGRGLYKVPQVGKLIRLQLAAQTPDDAIRRWANGYTRSYRGDPVDYPPVIKRELQSESPFITFVDFIELLFVAFFRDSRLSLPFIRAAAEEGARLFDTTHPFAVARFATDGRSIFAELEQRRPQVEGMSRETVIEELHIAQIVIPHMVAPYLRTIDWGDPLAVRYWPLGREERVVVDPHRSFGQPIDDETGVPTRALYDAVAAGDPPRTVADWFEVPLEAVVTAWHFERRLQAA